MDPLHSQPSPARLLRTLLDHTDSPVFCVRLDPPAPTGLPASELLVRALRDGTLELASSAALQWLGAGADDALGRPLAELFGSDPTGRRADPLRELFAAPDSVHRIRGGGGDCVTHLALRAARTAEDGSTGDSARLQTAGLLVTGIAHDYHNLLTVMLGSAELAMQQARQGDPSPHLEEIHAAARSAAALGQQLAALSYERAPELQSVDLTRLASRSVGMLRRLLDPSTELVLEVVAGTPRVIADPRQLEQALIGMVLAVRGVLPVDARLVVQAAEDDSRHRVRLRVVGRHPDSRSVEPSGPGLALARSVLELAGGSFEIEPVPDGTAVRAWLRPAYGGPRSLGEAQAEQHGQGGGARVLLVDDHDVLRNYVSRLLRSNGYEVHAVTRAEEALALPAEERAGVDMIVSDVLMPGMSGPEFLAHWREENPNTPALFTSGAAGSRSELQHWLGSDWQLIDKPFRNDDLLAALRKLSTG